jgi:hypothetical protein
MKSAALLLLALVVSACGANPSGPSSTPAPGAPLTGTVTATNGGQALGGVSVDLGGQLATTNAAGAFTVAAAGTASRLTLTGAGIVPRSLTLALGAPVAVDAIALGGGFDLGFYRQLVRNGFDDPANLRSVQRWTRAPQVYLKTVDEAGVAMDPALLDLTERTLREAAPIWAAGQFGLASVERGTGTRSGVAGWITVQWAATADPAHCARTTAIGGEAVIEFFYKTGGGCRCGGSAMSPSSMRHELGHAMGYYHTDTAADVMFSGGAACDRLPSARERLHAAIAYARPVGNVDPDSDPVR